MQPVLSYQPIGSGMLQDNVWSKITKTLMIISSFVEVKTLQPTKYKLN